MLDLMEMMMLFGNQVAPPGQHVHATTNGNDASWTVPPGVTEISAVLVAPGWPGRTALIKRGATTLFSSNATMVSGVGGGNGGFANGGGGGGAGGYTGNGGAGAAAVKDGLGFYIPAAGAAGSGGGGGGGGVGRDGSNNLIAGLGGGVGLLGTGANGAGGASGGGNGGNGSANGATYGQGHANGGNLRWRNAIPVTPGEVLTLNDGSLWTGSTYARGAIRIMWGGGRSYPNNALDM